MMGRVKEKKEEGKKINGLTCNDLFTGKISPR